MIEKVGSGAPRKRHRTRCLWAVVNLTGRTNALGKPQLNPGPTSGNNTPRITQDVRVQTGRLDEPIISPLLTLTMSLLLPAWLTFLESKKCRLTRVPLTRTDRPRIAPSSGEGQIKTHLQICVGRGFNIFPGGAGPGWWLHPLSLWHCCPVSGAATSWSSIFRRG